MKRIIVTPTFRPHFPFNREFLASYERNVADATFFPVHFVVTREEVVDMRALVAEFPALDLHVHAFEDMLEAAGYRDEPLALLRELGKFTYQSVKKLYALRALEYDQALLLDAEALVVKPVRLADVFDEYYADPYILYSDLESRGEHWFSGLSHAAVRNAAKLLRIPYPKMYFMEYYGWFYEKRLIDDLFAAFPEDLLPAIRGRLRGDTRVFENQLIYSYVLAHREQHPYRFVSVNEMLREYLGADGYVEYMAHFVGQSEQMGVFEWVSRTITEQNLPALKRLFTEKAFRFYRFELLNLNGELQQQLIDETPIAFLASSEGYRRTRERIAICLSGVARNPRQNIRFLRSFLAENDVDVFFHFWDTPERDYIVRVLEPKGYAFEDSKAAPPPPAFRRVEKFVPERRAPDITAMFYSIKRANDLKREYEDAHGFKYDIVVRLRLDFFSTRPLVDIIERIRFEQKGWHRIVYVPDMAHSMGLNDQMAMGSSETMDAYTSAYDTLPHIAEHDFFNPEYVLLRNVQAQGLHIRTFPFEYILLRNEPLSTFDIERLAHFTRTTWWSAQLPTILPGSLDAFFAAKADSVEAIDALDIDYPRVYRLRAGSKGYLRYDPESRAVGITPDAATAGLFFVVIASNEDRTAVNIRPRELVLGSVGKDGATGHGTSFYPDARGNVRADGPADEDAAFFIARAGDGVRFEWRPGFWKLPSDPRGPETRPPGGRNPVHTLEMRSGERRVLQATASGLAIVPSADDAEPFALEYVRDAEAEAVRIGPVQPARERVPESARDALPVRLLYFSFVAARVVSRRGPRALSIAAVDLVRRYAHEAERTNAPGVRAAVLRQIGKRL